MATTKRVRTVSPKACAASEVVYATKRYEEAKLDRIYAEKFAEGCSPMSMSVQAAKDAWDRENEAYAAMVRAQSWQRSLTV
jgi:hypothetical protein